MPNAARKSSINKRSVVIGGHKTSVSLESEFWQRLQEIAKWRGSTVSDLVAKIEMECDGSNLSSLVRVFVLNHFYARTQAREPFIDDAGAPIAEQSLSIAAAPAR